jgi:hypothetical protein
MLKNASDTNEKKNDNWTHCICRHPFDTSFCFFI